MPLSTDPPPSLLDRVWLLVSDMWTARSLSNGVTAVAAAVGLIGLGLVARLPWGWVAVGASAAAAALAGAYVLQRRAGGSPRGASGGTGSAIDQGKSVALDLAAVLPGIPDPVLVLDAALNVLDANDAAQALFPLRQGRSLALATRSPELLEAISAAVSSREAQSCTLRIVSPHEQILAARITPISSTVSDPGASALLVVLRDMTEAERLSRMRADFVANASHELRTPLASLKGFIETLQSAAKDDPAARERFLSIMQSQAERMSRLIEDLLSLSRIEMRERVAPSTTVDLGAIVADATKILRPQADAAGITLEIDPAMSSALVIGDRDELVQVAHNLVQNAIKYGRKGGRVCVGVRRDGARVHLDVVDDGIGIAPEHLPRLTERFYRVSAKDSRERGGTGLGLAIVKHIVSRHRGALDIRSRPGEGSTFSISLPSVQE